MTQILDFWLVVWTVRLLIITFGVGSSFIALLYLARFFRPKHIRALLTAELPTFKHVAAEVKVLGQELKASGDLVLEINREESAVMRRLEILEEQVRSLLGIVRRTVGPRVTLEGNDAGSGNEVSKRTARRSDRADSGDGPPA